MKKNKVLIISVVATLLLVAGITFAYIASTYIQSGNDQTVNVTTKEYSQVIYNGGASLSAVNNVNLAQGAGNFALATNQFSIYLKADSEYRSVVSFDVRLTDLTNTFEQTVNATNDNTNDLICNLYESSVSGTRGNVIASNINCLGTNDITIKENVSFETEADTEKTMYYTIELVLYNSSLPDNTNEGKEFRGTISISGVETSTKIPATINLAVVNGTSSSATLTGFIGEDSSEVDITPTSGYVYGSASCTGGTASYNIETKKFKVRDLTGNGNCTLNLISYSSTAGGTILTAWRNNPNVPVSDTPLPTTAFASVATTQVGVYPAEDDYGTSYYVRGASDYNYVRFGTVGGAPIWWNIIRINGDGTVRMIYRGIGETVPATGNTIDSQYFATSSGANNNNMYVGYMYTSGQRQGLGTSSNAKNQLETWYENNLSTNYGDYIADRIFCGDRSLDLTSGYNNSGTGTGITNTSYGARLRLYVEKTPILECPEEADKYTKENATENPSTGHGNGALTHPIGLITADEVSYAGGLYNTLNTGYYLYSNHFYWTMSPYYFYNSKSYSWLVTKEGKIVGFKSDSEYGLRAVINLKSNLTITGSGTSLQPFELVAS